VSAAVEQKFESRYDEMPNSRADLKMFMPQSEYTNNGDAQISLPRYPYVGSEMAVET